LLVVLISLVGGAERGVGGGTARAMFTQSFFFFGFVLLLQRSHFDRPINLFWGENIWALPPIIKVYRGASFRPSWIAYESSTLGRDKVWGYWELWGTSLGTSLGANTIGSHVQNFIGNFKRIQLSFIQISQLWPPCKNTLHKH
jgi:hypothetical protein